jgi:hypothetical protein
MVSSLLHVLIVTPAIFYSIHARRLRKHGATEAVGSEREKMKEPVLKES